MKKCKCGCGKVIPRLRTDGRPQAYYLGHNRRGLASHTKPNTTNHRTRRQRANRILRGQPCELEFTKQCKGRIEVHHKDADPTNNSASNICALCMTHHKMIETNKISFEQPMLPPFYEDKSGKRRYDWVSKCRYKVQRIYQK